MSKLTETKKYYASGELYQHAYWKGNIIHGKFTNYYKNGQVWEHRFYKDGKSHSERKKWSKHGNILIHEFYQNNNNITYNIKTLVVDILNITDEERMIIKLKFGIECLS